MILFLRFFENIDWGGVYRRKLQPPICPVIESDCDTAYFMEYSEDDSDKDEDTSKTVDKKHLALFQGF